MVAICSPVLQFFSLGSQKITMKAKVLGGLGRQGRFGRIGGLGGPTGTSDQRE